MTKEFDRRFPDDDGEKTMAWVTVSTERERLACERVIAVLSERPWVKGKVTETCCNDDEDVAGIDMKVPVDDQIFEVLGIKSHKGFLPVQVKSSKKAVREFLREKHMINRGKLVFSHGDYIMTVNGTDAKLLILADMVGQMVMLARERGMNEVEFLAFMNEWLGDKEAVETWYDQREVMKEVGWYGQFLDD